MSAKRADESLTTAVVTAAGERPKDQERTIPTRPSESPWSGPYATVSERDHPPVKPGSSHDERQALLDAKALQDLRARWMSIQTGFVDEPRQATERADRLVAETITRLAESFAQARASMEHQWDHGDTVSTEDLRQALRRYHSFFDRLLAV